MDNFKDHLLILNEYIDYGKLNKEWRNTPQEFNNNQPLSVNKQNIINQYGNSKRWKTLANIQQRENIIKPRFFNHNGNDYYQKIQTVANPREQRTLNKDLNSMKLNAKINNPQNWQSTFNDKINDPAPAAYNGNNYSIGINQKFFKDIEKNNPDLTFDKNIIINHELEHYKQDMAARKMFGKQGSLMMDKRAHKNYNTDDGYYSNPFEYGANKAALGMDTNDRNQIIRQTIQNKKYKGDRIKISPEQGKEMFDRVDDQAIDWKE